MRKRVFATGLATATVLPFVLHAQALPSDSLVSIIRRRIPELMQRLDVPGVVVSLVRGDSVILQEGFGVSDRGTKAPVDPSGTVFRVASVSKVFTALGVLQQVHAGKLSLVDDIRRWVPELPESRNQGPITLATLLTHTSGLDEQLIGYMAPPGDSAPPLEEFVLRHLPPRSRGSDGIPGYSNHGYALAALAAERVARKPFDQYLHEDVFLRLGMSHSSVIREPSHAVLASEYVSDGSERVRRASRAYPAGNVGMTGADASVFLRALMRGLRGDTAGPISPHVARQLAGPVLTYHTNMPPMGYGMSGVLVGGRTIWMKGGASPSHSALLALIPELDLGLFIALNRQEPTLWNRLVADLFAAPQGASPKAVGRGPRVDGSYLWTRTPLASPEKLLNLAAQVTVQRVPDGVRIEGLGELAGVWRAQGDSMFVRADGRQIGVRARGREATHLFSIVDGQPVAFERIPWWKSARTQTTALAAGSLLAVAVAATGLAVNNRYANGWTKASLLALPALELSTVGAVVAIAKQADLLAQGPTTSYQVGLALTTATAVAGLMQTATAGMLATRPGISSWKRGTFALGSLGGVAISSVLAYNNLITLSFR